MKTLEKHKYLFMALIFVSGLMSCDVQQKEQGELPEVDVDVDTESGNMPEYEVNWADIDVKTRTKTVKVPKLVVVMEEEEVEVPYLDMNMPEEFENASERTIKVEAEVSDNMHELEIEKVYAVGSKLIVISELERENRSLDGKRVRISDQIVINAPDNLSIKHYIVGDKPSGSFNVEYEYVGSEDEISSYIENAKLVYSD